jgi:uncharacterized membrane protein
MTQVTLHICVERMEGKSMKEKTMGINRMICFIAVNSLISVPGTSLLFISWTLMYGMLGGPKRPGISIILLVSYLLLIIVVNTFLLKKHFKWRYTFLILLIFVVTNILTNGLNNQIFDYYEENIEGEL